MTTTEQRTIPQILNAMAESCNSLAGVLASLDPADWHRPTGCPEWDVQDVVSHIIGLEDRLSGLPEPDHELATEPAHAHDPDSRRFEIHVDYRRQLSPEEMLRQFREATDRGIGLRRQSDRPAEEETDGPFGWRMPYWRLLSIRTFDCFAHEQDVRRAVGRPGNLDGEAAALVGDLIASVLPELLPTRVDALARRQVVVESVVGEDARRITIGAEGTSEEPTTLRIPFGQLVAFVCGRADADPKSVHIRGDQELAAQVLKAMAITP